MIANQHSADFEPPIAEPVVPIGAKARILAVVLLPALAVYTLFYYTCMFLLTLVIVSARWIWHGR